MVNPNTKLVCRKLVCIDPHARVILESYEAALRSLGQDALLEVVERGQDNHGRLTSLAVRVSHSA